jgi:cellulose synthase/poly-beta-1,6-N-acetylglucosamine synthase-like glycosyltransferase
LLLPLILLGRRSVKCELPRVGELPCVSLVVPTYNEEKIITEKIENILAQDYPVDRMEIVLVDCSSDNTLSKARAYSDKVKMVILKQEPGKGLADALNLGYSAARGTVIVKTDCDAFAEEPRALKRMVTHFSSDNIGAVSCVYSQRQGESEHDAVYRQALTMLQRLESDLDSSVVAHGAALAFLKKVRVPIDMTSEADDTELFVKVRKQGYRCIIDPETRFFELRPQSYLMSVAQRSRRARGVIRVLTANKEILFNHRFGMFGRIIFPLNFFLLVLSPPFLLVLALSSPLALSSVLHNQTSGCLSAIVFSVGALMIAITNRPRALSAFLQSQICAALGLAGLLFRRRSPLGWKKAR